jgi:hypothetical protein
MFRFDREDLVALYDGLPALLLAALFVLMALLGGR